MWSALNFVAGCLLLIVASSPVYAQKAFSCDRESSASKVVLHTPLGQVTGVICLDDGDSFGVGPTWLRLRGINAPEIRAGCLKRFPELPDRCLPSKGAIEALIVLSALIEKSVVCYSVRKDQYNRWIADCADTEGKSLSREMVARGFACATKEGREFRQADMDARMAGLGLWSSEWATMRSGFPSSDCIITARQFKRRVQYIESKRLRSKPIE